jgi:hypothetical protein
MFAQLLMLASTLIILSLGLMHAWITFRGNNLAPRESGLQEKLSNSHLVLTRQTTFWKAWIGFNASHAFGAVFFGLLYGYLALRHSDFLFHTPFLLGVGLLLLVGYFILGKVYWFSVPFRGISLALACYVASLFLY